MSVLLSEVVEGYFTARMPRKDSPHTTLAQRNDIRQVVGCLVAVTGVEAAALTTGDLSLSTMRRAFARYSSARGKASVRRAWSTWSTLFTYLVTESIVEGNPMVGIARPKAPRHQPKPFEEADAARIVRAVMDATVDRRDPWPEMERALVVSAMVTGARSAELLDANVGDLVGERAQARLRVRGKGDQDRHIPVEPVLLTLLGDYLDTRRARFPDSARRRGLADNPGPFDWWRPGDPLFVDRRGERMRRGALQYLVRTVYRAAGVDAVRAQGALVHALRHTAATRMVEHGATAVQLMDFLGHASLNTSQAYVKASARDVRAAAATNPVYGLLDG